MSIFGKNIVSKSNFDRIAYFRDFTRYPERMQTIQNFLDLQEQIKITSKNLGDDLVIPFGRKMCDNILRYLRQNGFNFSTSHSNLIELFKNRRHDEFSSFYLPIFQEPFKFNIGSKLEGDAIISIDKDYLHWKMVRTFDYNGHEFLDGYYKSFFRIPKNELQIFLDLVRDMVKDYFLTHIMDEELDEVDVGDSFSIENYIPTPTFTKLYDDIEKFLTNEKFYRDNNIPYKRGALLLGPPGNGKTHSFRYIMEKFKMPVVVPQEIGDTRYCVKQAFASAKQVSKFTGKPVLIFLEEVNAVLDSPFGREILLTYLDGIGDQGSYYFIGTTNRAKDIDPAIMNRPSRIDLVLEVKCPDKETRFNYFKNCFPDWHETVLHHLAHNTDTFSFAFLKNTYIEYVISNGGKELNAELMDKIVENQVAHIKMEAAKIETENKRKKELGFRNSRLISPAEDY